MKHAALALEADVKDALGGEGVAAGCLLVDLECGDRVFRGQRDPVGAAASWKSCGTTSSSNGSLLNSISPGILEGAQRPGDQPDYAGHDPECRAAWDRGAFAATPNAASLTTAKPSASDFSMRCG